MIVNKLLKLQLRWLSIWDVIIIQYCVCLVNEVDVAKPEKARPASNYLKRHVFAERFCSVEKGEEKNIFASEWNESLWLF